MALISSLPKLGRTLLISQLNQAKRRLEAVDKNHLDILFIDGRIGLEEKLYIEVLHEELM